MQTDITELISNSCGYSQTKVQEHLDSEIRYLCELQEADGLKGDDVRMACSNLGLDLNYQEYFIDRLVGA